MGEVFILPDITLQSKWKYSTTYSQFSTGPTEGSAYWSLAGAKTSKGVTFSSYILTNAVSQFNITFSVSSPLSGISSLKVNGVTTDGSGRVYNFIDTSPILVQFKANGSKTDDLEHTATLTIKNAKLTITSLKSTEFQGLKPTDYLANTARQNPLVILNASNSEYYLFDGVTKITHSLSSSFSDSTDANYSNSAKNEQDKVTIEAVMSDIHTQASGLTGYNPTTLSGSELERAKKTIDDYTNQVKTRSARALEKLWNLKTNRAKLVVVTNQCYYHNMVIAEINVVNDENHPFGWEGQIVLKRMVATKGSAPTLTGGKAAVGNDDSALFAIAGIVVQKNTSPGKKNKGKLDVEGATTGATAGAVVWIPTFDGTAVYT